MQYVIQFDPDTSKFANLYLRNCPNGHYMAVELEHATVFPTKQKADEIMHYFGISAAEVIEHQLK